jgi:2-polyprenyl-3-methyl-5-hydroxy-6-metoxy-1,4-benzoquinol methylase
VDEEQRPLGPTHLDDLLETLRRRVHERREAGDYPPGLELDLETHFRRIVETRPGPDHSRFQAKLDRLAAFSTFSAERIPTASNLPGGAAVHRAVAKAIGRQTRGILEQLQQFATAVRDVLEVLADPDAPSQDHRHPDLAGMVDVLVERLASYERAPVASGSGLAELYRRVEALEAMESRREFRPWFPRTRLLDALQGSWDDSRERYRDLAGHLVGAGPVLDVGCGRGELLSLLQELGVEASGVEVDEGLVEEARAHGLAVEQGDGLDHLAGLDDGSLGGIVLVEVIEHVTPQETADLALLARDKLRPGGRLLVETPNPQSLYGLAHQAHLDPTRQQLVHAAYLEFLLEEAGFARIEILLRSPPPEEDLLDEAPLDGDEARASEARRLNRLLFAPRDYALIATR